MEYINEIMQAIESYASTNSEYEYDVMYHLELLADFRDGLQDREDFNKVQQEIESICKEHSRCPQCFRTLYQTKINENSIKLWENPYECDDIYYVCEECNKLYDCSYVNNL